MTIDKITKDLMDKSDVLWLTRSTASHQQPRVITTTGIMVSVAYYDNDNSNNDKCINTNIISHCESF